MLAELRTTSTTIVSGCGPGFATPSPSPADRARARGARRRQKALGIGKRPRLECEEPNPSLPAAADFRASRSRALSFGGLWVTVTISCVFL